MSAYDFMTGSPWLTFFLAWIASALVFRLWNRTMRMVNIRKHGWPPAHCDADGDKVKLGSKPDA